MKRTYLVIIIFLFIAVTGCKKFLEETPYSFVDTNNFYKTAQDAELALTGVYDVLSARYLQGVGSAGTWGRGMQYLTTMGCDELIVDPSKTSSNQGIIDLFPLANYTVTSQNTVLSNAWFYLYAGINRANFIIEKVPDINMSATRRTEIVAEAHYLRGLYYLYLGWLWGGVPLTNSSASDYLAPRSSLKEVMEQVESDLKYAYDNLPNRNSADANRVNKYTAEAYLAKLYLYLASCKENNVGSEINFPLNNFAWVNQEDYYSKALTACEDVYNKSGYALVDSFSYLFLAATEQEARKEHIMIAPFGGMATNYSYYYYLAGPSGSYLTTGGTGGLIRPMREAYNRFNAADGRINGFSGTMASNASSVMINGVKYFIPQAIAKSLSNLCLYKWRECDPNTRTGQGLPAMGGETDWGLLRYADVILMYAESKYQTGDEAGARQLLSEVRKRAVGNNAAKLTTLTSAYKKANFIDELIDERSRELLGEGWRRFDLIRTGKLKSVVAALDESKMFTTENVTIVKENYADHKIWYPIPLVELSTNTNLIQNQGY